MRIADNFWPLKNEVLNYIYNTFLDSCDPNFLQPIEEKKHDDDDEEAFNEAPNINVTVNDREILLEYVMVVSKDIEIYLGEDKDKSIQKTILIYPNETAVSM